MMKRLLTIFGCVGNDLKETTDDHGMQIYGRAKDQMGNEYYMVKNSWGEVYEYKVMFYASKAFVRYKTMNYVVHKDAIPAAIREKLGIESSNSNAKVGKVKPSKKMNKKK